MKAALILAAVLALIASAYFFAPRCAPGEERFKIGNVKMQGC